ncbi:MAG: hypothetical protein ACRDN1_19350 [Trebonia sp.]
MQELGTRHALVTGTSRGIGLAIVRALVAESAGGTRTVSAELADSGGHEGGESGRSGRGRGQDRPPVFGRPDRGTRWPGAGRCRTERRADRVREELLGAAAPRPW